MDTLVRWDKELFLYLNNLGNQKFDDFWLFITSEYYWIPVYILLFIIVVEKYGWKKTLFICISIGIIITLTDQTASFFKTWVQRPRPCRNPELDGLFRLVIEDCRGTYCYFSAHAASSFGVATYLSALFYKKHKYAPFLLFLWAILVSYSRIYTGVHFPLDVVSGALVGLFTGWIFSKTQKYIL
ncbi:MAG: phosphatase PAP2 family protein [Flavobacteriaceae bacterium]|jgi:undecaprenyl-diphosphatase|nr:phosphatase PAP2 family protein [Flavobacteriaceae bacterium]